MTSTVRKSIVALLLLLPCPVLADVSLPAIFSDNMVLQRADCNIRVGKCRVPMKRLPLS